MIIYNNNKIDKALMNESDSKWDDLIAIARNNGFILSSNADGTVTICKNETALKMLTNDRNTKDVAEEILISRNKNLYDLDLRLKEKVYVYLSDNQKRIKNAKVVLLPTKKYNEKYYFFDCYDLSLIDLSFLEYIEVDKVIIDYREPMKSIAYKLVKGDQEKIIDDRQYNLSDTYQSSTEEELIESERKHPGGFLNLEEFLKSIGKFPKSDLHT